jgi:hypothetical protein
MPESETPTVSFEAMKLGETARITGKAQFVNTHDPEIIGTSGKEVFRLGSDNIIVACNVMKVELPDRRPGAHEGATIACFQMLQKNGPYLIPVESQFFLPTVKTVITPTSVTVIEQ